MTKEDILHHFQDINFYYNDCGMYDDLSRMLDELISENKGEWIKFKDFEEGYFHIKCSKCGQYWSIDDHAKIFKYCFNCGADMRGKAE